MLPQRSRRVALSLLLTGRARGWLHMVKGIFSHKYILVIISHSL